MTRTDLDASERTGTYVDGGTFVQWGTAVGSGNAVTIQFASAWNFTPTMDEWDIDRIDSAGPIFTKVTNILGTFSFNLKNLTTLYDEATASSLDPILLSSWIDDISKGNPPSILFAPIMTAPATSDTKDILSLVFTGRIMSVPIDQVLDQGVQDVVISGEITGFTSIDTAATAKILGAS